MANLFNFPLASLAFLTLPFHPVAHTQPAAAAAAAPLSSPDPVTFNRHIAPIALQSCAPCHRPTQSGPFNLITYDDFKSHAKIIRKVVTDRLMPPWLPEPGYAEFEGERRLTDAQVALLQRWIDTGMEQGRSEDLPTVPQWTEGWQLGPPDLILTLTEPFSLTNSGRDVWRTFVIPTPLPNTRFVRALEFRPGNRAVHHASMRLDPTRLSRAKDDEDPTPGFDGISFPDSARPPAGHLLNWLPGRSPYLSPPGMAWPFEKDSDLLVQLHLQPTGKPEQVQPSIGLYFTDQPPTNSLFAFPLMVRTLDIPAGEPNYRVRDSYRLPIDARVRWINPHAHYLGREIHAYATLPDGSRKWLLRIPHWDFNWQGDYSYRQPIALPRGSEIHMDYQFDNSANNPHNPHSPPQRVRFGQQSSDEMAELWIQLEIDDPRQRRILERDFQGKILRELADFYRHRLQSHPDDAKAHCRLGFALSSLGRPGEGQTHLRRAIELDPRYEEPHLHLALASYNQGSHDAAAGQLRVLLEINPKNSSAHALLGAVELARRRLDPAELHLRTAIELNPNDLTSRDQLDRLLRAKRAAGR